MRQFYCTEYKKNVPAYLRRGRHTHKLLNQAYTFTADDASAKGYDFSSESKSNDEFSRDKVCEDSHRGRDEEIEEIKFDGEFTEIASLHKDFDYDVVDNISSPISPSSSSSSSSSSFKASTAAWAAEVSRILFHSLYSCTFEDNH